MLHSSMSNYTHSRSKSGAHAITAAAGFISAVYNDSTELTELCMPTTATTYLIPLCLLALQRFSLFIFASAQLSHERAINAVTVRRLVCALVFALWAFSALALEGSCCGWSCCGWRSCCGWWCVISVAGAFGVDVVCATAHKACTRKMPRHPAATNVVGNPLQYIQPLEGIFWPRCYVNHLIVFRLCFKRPVVFVWLRPGAASALVAFKFVGCDRKCNHLCC